MVYLLFLPLYIFALVGVGVLADRLGRASVFHIIVSILLTPIPSLLYLLCAGKTQVKQYEDILLEEKMRAKARQDHHLARIEAEHKQSQQKPTQPQPGKKSQDA